MRIRASQQITLFLQDERRVEFGSSGDDELRSRSRRVQHRTGADCRQRLPRTTMRAENVVRRDTPAAETAIHSQDLNRLAAYRRAGHSVANQPVIQVVEMLH